MTTELDPVIGNWYQHLDKGQLFRVVDLSENGSLVEIQHFDGDIEEIELEAWHEMELELAEQPEDWTGPIDDIGEDDLGYTETDMARGDWRESYAETPKTKESWQDETPLDERDEWAEGKPEEDQYEEEP